MPMSEYGFSRFFLLFLTGGCGALSRYWLGGFVQRIYGGELPLGTFVINALGCLIFGFCWALADERLVISEETRLIILTGFVGSFTTFSTFAFESHALMRNAEWFWAFANVTGQCATGIAAVFAGVFLSRLI